jgi:phosphatidylethanolamine N-methyltransferase
MTIHRVVKELEGLVTSTKPAVEMIVEKTRRGVVKLADAARLEGSLPVKDLPLELYSLGIEGFEGRIRVPFGEPIRVDFVGCRETMKRKDWVGIYEIGANFDKTITTSTCGTRWGYLAGDIQPSQDPTNPDGRLFTRTKSRQLYFGSTPVTLTKSLVPGLRLVNGIITFDKMMVPWKTGVYEFRYHHDGKYDVIATSIPFEIVLPEKVTITGPRDIANQLLPVVKRCLDLGNEDFRADEGMLPRLPISPLNGNYERQVSERIIYAIKEMYGVDFSWKAIDNLYSLENLAERVIVVVDLRYMKL